MLAILPIMLTLCSMLLLSHYMLKHNRFKPTHTYWNVQCRATKLLKLLWNYVYQDCLIHLKLPSLKIRLIYMYLRGNIIIMYISNFSSTNKYRYIVHYVFHFHQQLQPGDTFMNYAKLLLVLKLAHIFWVQTINCCDNPLYRLLLMLFRYQFLRINLKNVGNTYLLALCSHAVANNYCYANDCYITMTVILIYCC